MPSKLEIRWIFVSVVMHGALLTGVVLASRPAVSPAPVILEVSLVSSLSVDITGGADPVSPSGTHPEPASVENGAGVQEKPAAGQFVPADQEPSEIPIKESNPEEKGTPDIVPGDIEGEAITESETVAEAKMGDRIHSAEITNDTSSEDISVNAVEQDSPESTDWYVAQHPASNPSTGLPSTGISAGSKGVGRQTSNRKLQTPMLAYAGNPSSLRGVYFGPDGSGLVRPEVVSMPEPDYPILSRRLGEEGRVVLKITIGAEGGVLRAEVVESSSYPRLDQAAMTAVRSASFHPAMRYGLPVSSERNVAYVFRLEEE